MSKLIWKDENGWLDTIKDEKRFLVALDMGLGKTSLLLALADYKIFEKKTAKKILIITPKKVSLTTWQNEIKKWSNLTHLKSAVRLIDGSKDKRISTFKATGEYTIDIISSGLTEWLTGEKQDVGVRVKRKKWVVNEHTPKYDLIIVEECSQFKNPQSKRYKALKKLAFNNELFLLSGTPFSNIRKIDENPNDIHYENADELYYAFNLLGLFNDTLTEFRKTFCYTLYQYDFNYKMKESVYNTLLEELGKKSITDKAKLDIKMNEIIIKTKTDLNALHQLTSEYVVDVGGEIIETDSEVGLINKALQIGSGFLYNYDKVIHLHRHKLDVVKKFIETTDRNVVIFYNFKEDKERLMKEFDCHLYTPENEKLWNEGKIRILLLSPFSEKYGLNIQYGGHDIIWYSLIWSAESYEQSNYRLYRRGQTKDVNIYYLIAEGGYDQHVFNTLVLKIDTKDELLEIIKENNKER